MKWIAFITVTLLSLPAAADPSYSVSIGAGFFQPDRGHLRTEFGGRHPSVQFGASFLPYRFIELGLGGSWSQVKKKDRKLSSFASSATFTVRGDLREEQAVVPFLGIGGVRAERNEALPWIYVHDVKFGWLARGGVMFRLDVLDRARALNLSEQFGIDDTFIALTAERIYVGATPAWSSNASFSMSF